MIIEARVTIDLKLDGSWRIVQIEHVADSRLATMLPEGSPSYAKVPTGHLRKLWGIGDEPEPETESAEQLDAAGPFTATEHLVNAHKVRQHRRREHSRDYPEHGHCSICGACGKKASTCYSFRDRPSSHRGEPFTGTGC